MRAFAFTFVSTFVRQMLFAFLHPIGPAVQSVVVWSTTLLLGALTAAILATVWASFMAGKYVWSQRDALVRVFWAAWADVVEVVRESYQTAKDSPPPSSISTEPDEQ